MLKIKTIDGNEACSYTSYIFTEVAGIYPITPSSPMAEAIDELSNSGLLNAFNDSVKVIEMQSEGGAAGLIHGSLQAGCLTTTYTASQGLLLMIPNMYKIAGEMLPGVMHVAARSLSTHALSIMGDHQDIYAARQTGFAMLASSSVQQASDLAAVAHLSAIKGSIPFMHFFDGFRTSHEINKINVLDKEDLIPLIDMEALNKFRMNALNPFKPITKGTAQSDDIYFQATEVRNKFYDAIPSIVNGYMEKINALTNQNYLPFNYYGSKTAMSVIVAMGSVCETIKETIDYLNKNGENVGLIEVHLYRPFSREFLMNVLPKTVTKIAVLDRTKEPGSLGEPLYLDVISAINNSNIKIIGGRYGLSSKNTTPAQIKAVYDYLNNNPEHPFTIGIDDDVTNLSLKVDESFKISDSEEFLIYGYGSDGMVSAAKSIIKLVGENTPKYVQGYFQYDSKKSGGVTISHLRFNKNLIRSTYYVENPKIIVCTKDTYLGDFDLLSNIQDGGIFILNTSKTKDEVLTMLTDNHKKILTDRQIKFYIINAYKLAESVGLGNKISTIMETIIVSLADVIDYNIAKDKMKAIVKDKFARHGDDVVNANYQAMDKAIAALEALSIPEGNYVNIKEESSKNIFTAMMRREGNKIPTSAFLKYPNGAFPSGTSSLEKRGISEMVPSYIKDNCIQCNLCSLVCPHGVIRPFLLNQAEYDAAPGVIKNNCLKPLEKDLADYYYTIGISPLDCTGCGLCIKTCPGKQNIKALTFKDLDSEIKADKQKAFDYLISHVSDKKEVNINTVKGSQFKQPKFAFSGACAGCGETAYIKLLTQLLGDRMIIANATGCSSIYGASTPSTPYTVPWASSLFEDNAEYGYGILIANNVLRNRIAHIMENNMDNSNKDLFKKWLDNREDYLITKDVYDNLNKDLPKELIELKDYLPTRSIWTIGGDGWAYDIGFGGIDHVLASGEDVNILVLDSQVYSNTGGQASKSSPKGSIASFAANGKKTNPKDLARIAMSYPNVYVAQVNLGANPNQLLKAFNEASNYHGPSIIIAYTPCISHGIKGGLENSIDHEKMATKSGYYPIFRYNPDEAKFHLDSAEVDFSLYDDFLNSQTRYQMLKVVNPIKSEALLKANKENAMAKYAYYQSLVKSDKEAL